MDHETLTSMEDDQVVPHYPISSSSSSSISVLSFERTESSTHTSVEDHDTSSAMGDDQMVPHYPMNINPSTEFVSNPGEENVVNLREWIETKGEASKADLVGLFRAIVMLVDGLHQQDMVLLDLRPSMFDLKGDGVVYSGRVTRNNARKRGLGEEGPSGEFPADHMEKEWYAFPEEFENNDLAYFNVHCLGLLLFEFLSHFERIEEYNEAMMCLHHRSLPPGFFSGTYKEAQSCFWLLRPEPSSYPTTREILDSKWLCELESTISSTDDEDSINANEAAEKTYAIGKYLGTEDKDVPESSTSRKNVLEGRLRE